MGDCASAYDVAPRSADYDLRRPDDITKVFDTAGHFFRPKQTLVIHAAAHVGRRCGDSPSAGDLLHDNLLMGIQLLDAGASERCQIRYGTVARGKQRGIWSGQVDAPGPRPGLSQPVRVQFRRVLDATELRAPLERAGQARFFTSASSSEGVLQRLWAEAVAIEILPV
jgi:hypothetical protein